MTADEFRKLALALPEATESAHMSHPDFRVRNKIFATLGPFRLTGWAQGQYFLASKLNDDHVYEEGADGEAWFVRMPSSAWTITLTMVQTSLDNTFLWEQRRLDLATPGGLLLPFGIEHRGTVLVSAKTRIMRPPDIGFSSGTGETRVWTLTATNFDGVVLGLTSP